MHKLICLGAAAAFALLGATAAASAKDHGWKKDDGKHHSDHDGDWKDKDHDGDHGWKKGGHHKGWNKDWDRHHGWWNRPAWWNHHNWHRGMFFRRYDNDNYFVIDDWWFYGLEPPPRGYIWIRTWDGFILVRVSDNFILNFVIN